MSRARVNFIIFILGALGSLVCFGQGEFWLGPFFWQERAEIQEKMRTQRYVPVSVTSTEVDQTKTWWMKGAGVVKAPMNFVFDKSRDFEEIKKLKQYFQSVSWNKKKTKLQIVPEFLSKKLTMELKLWESKGKGLRRLHFKIVKGPFKNGEGAFLFKETSRQESEVGLITRYEGEVSSFGSGVFAIAVEGVLHHMANSLRSYVENAWEVKKEKISVH